MRVNWLKCALPAIVLCALPAGAQARKTCLSDDIVRAAQCASDVCGQRKIDCETGEFQGSSFPDHTYRYRCFCGGVSDGDQGERFEDVVAPSLPAPGLAGPKGPPVSVGRRPVPSATPQR